MHSAKDEEAPEADGHNNNVTAGEYVTEWQWVAPNYILDKQEAKMWSIDISLEHISASSSDKVSYTLVAHGRVVGFVSLEAVPVAVMASNSLVMASNSLVMASNSLMMASKSLVMASKSLMMASNSLMMASKSLVMASKSLVMASNSLVMASNSPGSGTHRSRQNSYHQTTCSCTRANDARAKGHHDDQLAL